MTDHPCPPARLLPHAPPMLLLDQTLSTTLTGARAVVTIGPDSAFAGPHGVPAHVALEYMAQTCGLWAGGEARRQGGAVRLGYLLGTRRFKAARDFLGLGERLEISAELTFRDGGMGVFDCRVESADGQVLAQAQLSVYQPETEGEEP